MVAVWVVFHKRIVSSGCSFSLDNALEHCCCFAPGSGACSAHMFASVVSADSRLSSRGEDMNQSAVGYNLEQSFGPAGSLVARIYSSLAIHKHRAEKHTLNIASALFLSIFSLSTDMGSA